MGITQFQKKVKITFRNKDAYEQFLKAELIVREQKENLDEIINVKLKILPLKPEKPQPVSKENTNDRTI